VSPQGAVEIDGRKVSGSSGGFDGPSVIVQGTVLVEFDRDEMTRLLRNRSTPVTSLADCFGHAPSIGAVQAALSMGLDGVWDGATVTSDLRGDELALTDKLLADEIGTDEFVMRTPAKRQGANP
jgi:lipoate-protein ligase A